MFLYDWQQWPKWLKLRETTNNQYRNIIRWNIHRDNNFHLRSQVSRLNPESCKHLNNLSRLFYVLSQLSSVFYFSRWARGKKIARSFLFTAKVINRYSSEHFLSIWGQKMSESSVSLCQMWYQVRSLPQNILQKCVAT